jgi:dTDP-4-amino-4,6-dideoxygalactose transaminase
MVVTNDPSLAEKLQQAQSKFGYPSYYWIFQQLLHPVLMNCLILPTYRILGKYLLVLFQWLHILSKAVHWKEKRGKKPDYFPKKMPNALAILAQNQLKKLEKFNKHRKEIAEFYFQELKNTDFITVGEYEDRKNIFLRFPVKHPKAHKIIKKAWESNLLIGDWYDKVIAPRDTKLDKMQYILGSCPIAERLSEETFNLPTHINISINEAKRITDFLKKLEK